MPYVTGRRRHRWLTAVAAAAAVRLVTPQLAVGQISSEVANWLARSLQNGQIGRDLTIRRVTPTSASPREWTQSRRCLARLNLPTPSSNYRSLRFIDRNGQPALSGLGEGCGVEGAETEDKMT